MKWKNSIFAKGYRFFKYCKTFKKKVFLFGIPILKIRQKIDGTKEYYLFSFLKVLKIK